MLLGTALSSSFVNSQDLKSALEMLTETGAAVVASFIYSLCGFG